MQKKNKYNETKGSKRWLFVILGNIVMLCMGTIYSWSVFRIPIEKLFNIGATESGLPYMVSLAFYALFMMFSGRFINTFSPRVIMSVGAILIAVGWILSSLANNIYLLTFSYGALSGAGVGISYGVPLNVVTKWFPDKKGLAAGLVLVGFGLSPLLTAPIANMLVEKYGVMNTFMILGIVFFFIIFLLSMFFRYPDEYTSEKSKQVTLNKKQLNDITPKQMIKTHSFKTLYLNFLIGTMIGLMLVGMTSKVGNEMIGLTSDKVTNLMLLFAVFNGLGRPIFGWLTDKLSYPKTAILSYGIIALAAFLMIIARKSNAVLFVISFSLFWFNLGGWLAIAPTATASLFGTQNYSRNYGIVFTAYGIGAVLGVMGSGMIVDLIGSYKAIFYMVIALCILGFGIVKMRR